jgi:hypothetical protein
MLLVAVKWESQSGFREKQADLNEVTCQKIQVVELGSIGAGGADFTG